MFKIDAVGNVADKPTFRIEVQFPEGNCTSILKVSNLLFLLS